MYVPESPSSNRTANVPLLPADGRAVILPSYQAQPLQSTQSASMCCPRRSALAPLLVAMAWASQKGSILDLRPESTFLRLILRDKCICIYCIYIYRCIWHVCHTVEFICCYNTHNPSLAEPKLSATVSTNQFATMQAGHGIYDHTCTRRCRGFGICNLVDICLPQRCLPVASTPACRSHCLAMTGWMYADMLGRFTRSRRAAVKRNILPFFGTRIQFTCYSILYTIY